MEDKDLKEIVDVLQDVVYHFSWVVADNQDEAVMDRVRALIVKYEKP